MYKADKEMMIWCEWLKVFSWQIGQLSESTSGTKTTQHCRAPPSLLASAFSPWSRRRRTASGRRPRSTGRPRRSSSWSASPSSASTGTRRTLTRWGNRAPRIGDFPWETSSSRLVRWRKRNFCANNQENCGQGASPARDASLLVPLCGRMKIMMNRWEDVAILPMVQD